VRSKEREIIHSLNFTIPREQRKHKAIKVNITPEEFQRIVPWKTTIGKYVKDQMGDSLGLLRGLTNFFTPWYDQRLLKYIPYFLSTRRR